MKKYRRQILIETLKPLLARCGNQCAFSDCTHPIFDENNIFIAQLCHIEAVSPKGQRYNENKTDEEINSYENLVFLCYRHHKVTDNVELYSVEKLKEIKAVHEAKFKEATYDFPPEVLANLVIEIENFWLKIEQLHAEHILPELAVPINTSDDILALIGEIKENISNLRELNDDFMLDFKTTHFESVCLSMPNNLTRVSVAIDQLEIKYLEELVLKQPNNKKLTKRLKKVRTNFEKIAKYVGLAD